MNRVKKLTDGKDEYYIDGVSFIYSPFLVYNPQK